MKKLLVLIISLSSFVLLYAQDKQLSQDAIVSVLTIGPGSSLNDAFGHNAFRIKDTKHNLDITYDYGRFDFEAPNFYLNFARGKLLYAIGKSDYYDFLRFYQWQNRDIKEQVLNLSAVEKQKLFSYLSENYKPENRAYRYDFFYDNCATKIKDVVNLVLNESVEFQQPKTFRPKTFRTLIQNRLYWNSWGSLGIDIALGSVIDRMATAEEHMFLPEYIHLFFENAINSTRKQPLINNSHIVFQENDVSETSNFLTSPLFIFGVLSICILWITFRDYKNLQRTKWLDITIFTLTGLIGVFLLLLWFATDHTATANNYNLLWAFVLNILFVVQVAKNKPKLWFVKYLKLLVIMLCLLLLHWIIGVQVFALALIPVLIALFVRYIYLIRYYQKEPKSIYSKK